MARPKAGRAFRPRSRVLGGGVLAAMILLAGCTGGTTGGSTGTVSLTSAVGSATPTTSSSRATPTPVTPDGLAMGPGVTDSAIDLGLIVSPTRDRGFSSGVGLWQQSVNATGGICGRSIIVATAPDGEDMAAAYDRLARGVLGFLALPDPSDSATLAAKSSADGITVLLPSGSSADLSAAGPVILGATDDIQTINALSYLVSTGTVTDRGVVGVLTDGSQHSANALAGARWWARRNSATLDVRSTSSSAFGDRGQAQAVLVLGDPGQVAQALEASAPDVTVLTSLDGYDPKKVTAVDAKRLLIMLPTPAFGSDHPAAAAVARAFTDSGKNAPGARMLSGYAVAASWGRLLTQACTIRALTRSGVLSALTSVGPASVDSLFGPSNPALVVDSSLPATRVSSMALADPAAPGGLRPLIWMQAAPGIADYVPRRP